MKTGALKKKILATYALNTYDGHSYVPGVGHSKMSKTWVLSSLSREVSCMNLPLWYNEVSAVVALEDTKRRPLIQPGSHQRKLLEAVIQIGFTLPFSALGLL